MKKFLKILGGIVLAFVVLIGGGLLYFISAFPKVGAAPNLKIELTPEKIARGKYLANHVSSCNHCHATRDFNYYSGPIIPGTEGQGGKEFPEAVGTFYPRNITPAALGNWTDGEIVRALTSGLSKDGTVLFPIMPYPSINHMAQDDVEAIVAYLRTLPPIQNELPKSKINFPLNLLIRIVPQPYNPQPRPPAADTLAYGKYMATISDCAGCHTPIDDKGQALPGMDFAGGTEFKDPALGTMRAANITPENDTGIGAWDRAYFMGRFKEYADSSGSHIPVAKGEANTVMPWTLFAGMTDDDLNAIYSYLRTVKPVRHEVEKFSPLVAAAQ